jgi:AcrR family transcriptional regulator
MTITPWGDAAQLRSRKLTPGSRMPRELVGRSQRERLFAATVAVVAQKGYEAMRVADLVELSGVSRSTFYEHFSDKRECFLATADAIVELAVGPIAQALDRHGPGDRRLRSGLETFVELVVDYPAAARMYLVEIYAAGPEGAERVDRGLRTLERIVRRNLGDFPDRAAMPSDLIRAILGGLRRIVQTRLRQGREAELPAMVPDLWRWMSSYRTPRERLRRARPRPMSPAPPRYVAHDQAERILRAVAVTVEEKGYPAVTVADIARTAATSLSTFYAHFANKEEALLAALDSIQAQALAATLPPFERAPDWPRAVRAGLYALFDYTAVQPAWANLGYVAIFSAGVRALERGDRAVAAFHGALADGFTLAPETPLIAAEAIGGAVHALMYEHVRSRGAERMTALAPTATFLALAPFIGTDAACAIANEPDDSRGRARAAEPSVGGD